MVISRASGYEILQKGVDNMITGQIIQTSIDELKAITKVDLGVYDLNGSDHGLCSIPCGQSGDRSASSSEDP